MKKSKKFIITCIVMAVIMLLSAVAIFAATYWDAAGGGTISAGSTGGTGNAVPSDYANKSDYPISGLRISIVNSYSGQTRTGCLNFVAEGDGTYLGRKMFETKYNKVQMLNNWNGGFGLVDSTSPSIGLAQPTGYEARSFAGLTSESLISWEKNDWNLRVVASLLICGDTSRAGEPLETLLNPGDRIIIEALYPLKINNINYYLTCSEYASMCATAYGNVNAVAGNTSNKGQISFIGQTLNYYWPNGMHAPNGTISGCGIGPAPTLSSQATFWQLISQAYGMHIAYTDARPNNVTFTVSEVFDIVSDDGLSVTGDTQIYSNSFTVTSGSTINIVDYLSTTRLAGNRNGDWPAWPRTGVTISANGTTYSNPWSYRFDGSWANGLTGHSSNVNQQYVIGSDGITITVRYVPNDAHLTIRNKVAIYDQNTHSLKEETLKEANSYSVALSSVMNIKDKLKSLDTYGTGKVGSPYYPLTSTVWRSSGYTKTYEGANYVISQNQTWNYGYPYTSTDKFGFTMCKRDNTEINDETTKAAEGVYSGNIIDAYYTPKLSNFTIEYYLDESTEPFATESNVYYQPEYTYDSAHIQEGETFSIADYYRSAETIKSKFGVDIGSAKVAHSTITRNGSVENTEKTTKWTVTTNDNGAVVKIYYSSPVQLTVNHYLDDATIPEFVDIETLEAGRTFADGIGIIGDTVIPKTYIKSVDSFKYYAVLEKVVIDGIEIYVDDIKNGYEYTIGNTDSVIDMYYAAKKVNVNIQFYRNEETVPFARETQTHKGYFEYDSEHIQNGDVLKMSNFLYTTEELKTKFPNNPRAVLKTDSSVEAVSINGNLITGKDNIKDTKYTIPDMNDVVIKVYYSEPITVKVNHYVDDAPSASISQSLESILASRYLADTGYCTAGQVIKPNDYCLPSGTFDVPTIVTKIIVDGNEVEVGNDDVAINTSNKDMIIEIYYNTQVSFTVRTYIMNPTTGQYDLKDTQCIGTAYRKNSLIDNINQYVKSGLVDDKNRPVYLQKAVFNSTPLAIEKHEDNNNTITDESASRTMMSKANNYLDMYYDRNFKTIAFNYNYIFFTAPSEESPTYPYFTNLDWNINSEKLEDGKYVDDEGNVKYAFEYHGIGETAQSDYYFVNIYEDNLSVTGKEISLSQYNPENELHSTIFNGKNKQNQAAAEKFNVPTKTVNEYRNCVITTDGNDGKLYSGDFSHNISYDEFSDDTTFNFFYGPCSYKITYDKNSTTAKDTQVTLDSDVTVNAMEYEETKAGFIKSGENYKIVKNQFVDFGNKFLGWTAQDLNTNLWYGYKLKDGSSNELVLGWYSIDELVKDNIDKYKSNGYKITENGCYLISDEEEVNFSKTWGIIKLSAQWAENTNDLEGTKLRVFFSMNSSPSTANGDLVSQANIAEYSDSIPMSMQYISRGTQTGSSNKYENASLELKSNTLSKEGYDFIGWKLELVPISSIGNSLGDENNNLNDNTVYDTSVGKNTFDKSSSKGRVWAKSFKGTITSTTTNDWRLPSECKWSFSTFGSGTSFDPFNYTSADYISSDLLAKVDYGGVLIDDNGSVPSKVFNYISSGQEENYCIICYAQWAEAKPKFTVEFRNSEGGPAWGENENRLTAVSYDYRINGTGSTTKGYETSYASSSEHYNSQSFARYAVLNKNEMKASIRLYRLEENYAKDDRAWSDFENPDNYDDFNFTYSIKDGSPVVSLTSKNDASGILYDSDTWGSYTAEVDEAGNKIIITLYADYEINYDRNQGHDNDDIVKIGSVDVASNHNVLSYFDDSLLFTADYPAKYAGCEAYRVYQYFDYDNVTQKAYLAYGANGLDWYKLSEITENDYEYYTIKAGDNFGPDSITNFNYLVRMNDAVYFEAQWQAKVNIVFEDEAGNPAFGANSANNITTWASALSVIDGDNKVVSSAAIRVASSTYFNNAAQYLYAANENYTADIIISNDGKYLTDAQSYNMLSFVYNPSNGASEDQNQNYGQKMRLRNNEMWSHYSINIEAHNDAPDVVRITLYDDYYNIVFDANGGTGSMNGQKALANESIALNKNAFTRENYDFRFWYASYEDNNNTLWYGYNTADEANGANWYSEKDIDHKAVIKDEALVNFNLSKTVVTMHAQWAARFTVNYLDENGNLAFDAWGNTVSYFNEKTNTNEWIADTTLSSSSYYPMNLTVTDTISPEATTLNSAVLYHSKMNGDMTDGCVSFKFNYNMTSGVSKANGVVYDDVVLINENGDTPIEDRTWNAYSISIPDAHTVNITLLKLHYTIEYDANGGIGDMASQKAYAFEPIQLRKNTFTKDDFTYRFWNASCVDKNGNTLWYGYNDVNSTKADWYKESELYKKAALQDASIVNFKLYNATVTMHAQWAADFNVTYVDENGNMAFNSWYNTVTYRTTSAKSYWLSTKTEASTKYYPTDVLKSDIEDTKTFTAYAILYNYNQSSTKNGYQSLRFDYNINTGVMKRANTVYDEIVPFNSNGISPIEGQKWNAYKLSIVDAHNIVITLYKIDYSINYNGNGGVGSAPTQTALPNTDITTISNPFVKEETVKGTTLTSQFRYWYMKDDSTGKWYGYSTAGDTTTLGWYDAPAEYYKVSNGETLNLNKWDGGSITLYAQWLTPFMIEYVDSNYQPMFTENDPAFKNWSTGMRIQYKNSSNATKYTYDYSWCNNNIYMTSDSQYSTIEKDGTTKVVTLPDNGKIVNSTNIMMFIASDNTHSYLSGESYRDKYWIGYDSNTGLKQCNSQKYGEDVEFTNNKYFDSYKLEIVSPYYLRVILTPKTYTVNYDGNGAEGFMSSDVTRFNVTYTVKNNEFYKNYDSSFRSWYMHDDDNNTWYGYSAYGDETTLGWYSNPVQFYNVNEGEKLTLDKIEGSITLYAQWFTPFTVNYVKNEYIAETGEYVEVPAFDNWNTYVFGRGLHSDKGSAVNSSFNDSTSATTTYPYSQEYFYGGTTSAGYFGKDLQYSLRIGKARSTSYAGYVTIMPFIYNTNTGVSKDTNPTRQCQNCYNIFAQSKLTFKDGHYYCTNCGTQFTDSEYDTVILFGSRGPQGWYGYKMNIVSQNEIKVTLYTKDELVNHYDVHYDKNADDAIGTMNSSHQYFYEPFTLDKCAFTREGYNFRGWAVRDDNTGSYLCYDVNGDAIWKDNPDNLVYLEDGCENVSFPISELPENNGSITFIAQWQAGFNVHFITQYGAKAFTSWNSAVRYENNTYSYLSHSTSADTRYFASSDNIAIGSKFESYVLFGNTADATLSPSLIDTLNVVRFNYDAENGITMSDNQVYDTKIPITGCEDWTAYSVSINEETGDIYITLYEPPRELSIEYYQPNANYTCGTTVIATFKVTNDTKYNYNPDDGIATMTVTMTGYAGFNKKDFQYGTYTKDFVIPAHKSQNVYFKVPIPKDTATEKIHITASITYEGVVIAEYDITTNDDVSGYTTKVVSVSKRVSPPYGYSTKIPDGYSYIASADVPAKKVPNAASWDEYVYLGNGKYEKKTYYSLLRLDAGSTRPNTYCPVWWYNTDKNDRLNKPNFYKLMRSGYGIDVFYSSGFYTSDRIASITNGVPCTDTNAFVPAQLSKIYYPDNNYGAFIMPREFYDKQVYNYAYNDYTFDLAYDNEFASHYWNRVSSSWIDNNTITDTQFNTATRSYFAKFKHLTPMWVKDGDYVVQPVVTDAWTPAGMLSASNTIDTTGIQGSMYDDWRWVSGETK